MADSKDTRMAGAGRPKALTLRADNISPTQHHIDEGVRHVATVYGTRADARMFVATPDLLAACLELIHGDDLQAAIDKARAALQKATGGAV